MKYSELKTIIRNIKRNVPCNECGHGFKEKDISVVAMLHDMVVCNILCPECGTHTVAQISLMGEARQLSYNKVNGEPITKDDVLDMHNFLKNFKGDIKDYFKQ
jgi:hypothetical protein